MFKQYEAGSKNWTTIGNLSSKEKVSLITAMETDIMRNRKPYPDEYIYWLSVSFEEERSDAGTFKGFKKSSYYIEKLDWLRRKNYSLERMQKVSALLDAIAGQVPADQVDELRDTYEELTVLT